MSLAGAPPTEHAPPDAAPSAAGELAPGVELRRGLTIVKKLGEGGMGCVYEALESDPKAGIERPVAVKVMGQRLAAIEEERRRFLDEIAAPNRVVHPNVIKVHYHGVLPGRIEQLWYAMELLKGETLAERIARGPLEFSAARKLFGEALGALEAVHQAGMLHRDLKPENLWIVQASFGEHCLKILDFGIAKPREGRRAKSTREGYWTGTPEYMSPEHLLGKKSIDERTDIFAMGVILYESFTGGKLPFEDKEALIHRDPVPPSSWGLKDKPLEQLILACLEKDPDKRPGSARELRDRLDRVLARLSGNEPDAEDPLILGQQRTVPASPSAPYSIPGVSNSKAAVRRWALVGVAAVGLVAAAFFLVSRSQTSSDPISRVSTQQTPPPSPSVAVESPTPPVASAHISVELSDQQRGTFFVDDNKVAEDARVLAKFEVEPGFHRLRVEASDRESCEKEITVRAGEDYSDRISLRARTHPKPAPRPPTAASPGPSAPVKVPEETGKPASPLLPTR